MKPERVKHTEIHPIVKAERDRALAKVEELEKDYNEAARCFANAVTSCVKQRERAEAAEKALVKVEGERDESRERFWKRNKELLAKQREVDDVEAELRALRAGVEAEVEAMRSAAQALSDEAHLALNVHAARLSALLDPPSGDELAATADKSESAEPSGASPPAPPSGDEEPKEKWSSEKFMAHVLNPCFPDNTEPPDTDAPSKTCPCGCGVPMDPDYAKWREGKA